MQSFEEMDLDNCDIWQLKPLQRARSAQFLKQFSNRQPLEDVSFDPNSQDSAYSTASSEDSKSQGFRFAEPAGLAPRRSSTLEFSPSSSRSNFTMTSPSSSFCRNLSNFSDMSDEGFMDYYSSSNKLQIQDENSELPVGFNTLLAGSFKNTPSSVSAICPNSSSSNNSSSPSFACKKKMRRCLSENFTPSRFSKALSIRDVSMESSPISTLTSSNNKRQHPQPLGLSDNSPSLFKRCRLDLSEVSHPLSIVRGDLPKTAPATTKPKVTLFDYGFKKLRRSMSDSEATIEQALARASLDPNLIGDFSKPFILPLLTDGKHHDLKNISSHTLARLIQGEFNTFVDKYLIIDCRYPYEYEGGHIRGAVNIYTREHMIKEFIENKIHAQRSNGDKRCVLIFHCEYSAERGPTLSRFLRSEDRAHNAYPALDYPEMYLLNGGYKQFYNDHKELCDPCGYLPMADPQYKSDFQTFRSKSKTWSCDYKATKSKPRKRLGI